MSINAVLVWKIFLYYPFFLVFLIQNNVMYKWLKLNLSITEVHWEHLCCWCAHLCCRGHGGVQEAAWPRLAEELSTQTLAGMGKVPWDVWVFYKTVQPFTVTEKIFHVSSIVPPYWGFNVYSHSMLHVTVFYFLWSDLV